MVSVGEIVSNPNLKVFTFKDLKAATKKFGRDSLLGEGKHGPVYKGWLDQTTYKPAKPGVGFPVAIKHIKYPYNLNGFNQLQFKHKQDNIQSRSKPSTYMGTQEKEGGEPLAWDIRLKIAIDAARGFAFLHSLEDASAIYYSFNISKILLDREYNAKLSDFELFKYEQINVEHAIIITSYHTSPEGFTGTAPFLCNPRKVKKIVDPRLQHKKYPSQVAMIQAAELIHNCLNQHPTTRPSMEQVLQTLQQIKALDSSTV
ncbi:hypothetical protein Q3G72_018727 [Acer saccharum]|nr:hypothetical protein Q3G72_018727 [Acer saccharum]